MIPVRARIVHLSDLHFSEQREQRAILDQLGDLLPALSPDYVVVTGDLVEAPSRRLMRQANAWLTLLVGRCASHPKLLVIPGNRDYKSAHGWGGRFARLAFLEQFGGRQWSHAKWWWHCFRSGTPKQPLEYLLDEEKGIAWFTFDSTSIVAMGEVGFSDLHTLDAFFRNPQNRQACELMTKIALVHHHPLPGRYAAETPLERPGDSLMVFFNAGHFLKRLCDHHFSAVLHGHHHFANLARYFTGEEKDGAVSVLGAGSAASLPLEDHRGHHFYVLDLREDDTLELHSHFFSGGEKRLGASRDLELSGLDEVRQARLQALTRKEGLTEETVRQHVRLTRDGYADVRLEHLRCQSLRPDGVEKIPLEISVPAPSYLRDVKLAPSQQFQRFSQEESGLRHFRATWHLARGQNHFDRAVRFRVMNGHTLTQPELHRRDGRPGVWESSSLLCSSAAGALEIVVEFPAGLEGQAPEVQAHYVPWPWNRANGAAGQLREHPQETARVSVGVKQNGGIISFRCVDPIPGFVYTLRWRVKEIVDSGPRRYTAEGKVAAGKKVLVDLSRAAARGEVAGLEYSERVQRDLHILARSVQSVLNFLEPEDLETSLMVFNPIAQGPAQGLQMVAANFGEPVDWVGDWFAPGEGVAGFAYQKARLSLYHGSEDPLGYYLSGSERERAAKPPHTVLLSVPWVYRGAAVGAVNVGSRRNDSQLSLLFDLEAREQERLARSLGALATMCGNGIMEEFRREYAASLGSE